MGLDKILGLGKLPPKAFADYVAKVAEEHGWMAEPEIDHEGFRIRGGGHEISLANIYQSFLAAPRSKRTEYVSSTLEVLLAPPPFPATFEEAGPLLMPRLRDEGFVALHTLASPDEPDRVIGRRPVAPGLVVTAVVDGARSMTTVHYDAIHQWGVSLDAVLDRAERNLLDISSPSFERVAADVWLWTSDDAYAASRVVLPHILQSLTFDPYVVVPHRDMLLVASSRSQQAIAKLVTIMESQLERESYPITRTIYQLRERLYVPIELAAEHPMADRYRNLLLREAASRYAEESGLLQDVVGEDVYVATFNLQERAHGPLRSYAVWTNGVATLLPEVEFVVAFDVEAERAWELPWERAIAQPGLLSRTDYPLPRWRTNAFPSRALLETLGTPMAKAP